MSTGIQWTDETWNPVTGCSKVSPGCAHCYAETNAIRLWPTQYHMQARLRGLDRNRQFTDVWCHEDRLTQPLHWKKPRRIFVNSMSDLFHEAVPFEFIKRVWDVIAQAQHHTFQILTKRPARMREFAQWLAGADDISIAEWPRNAWLGVSVENQPMYDKRIGLLLRTPAAVRFLSVEPMLGPIDMRMGGMSLPDYSAHDPLPQIDWIIVGGESGPNARPFEIAWARSIVQQCKAAGVPVFVKQLGTNAIDGKLTAKELVEGGAGRPRPVDQPLTEAAAADLLDGYGVGVMNRPVALRDRKGGDPEEWPADLRVREFPNTQRAR